MKITRKFEQRHRRNGFTLLELVVTMGIIGLLCALILPAVQSAREAARRVSCKSQLRQLAMGFHTHEAAYRRLPANGWGYRWVGVPDRGTDRHQPGGWIYNLLPFCEQDGLRLRGKSEPSFTQMTTLQQLMQFNLPLLRCPSRNGAAVSPALNWAQPWNANPAEDVAKTDYAVNEGDYITDTDDGPVSLFWGDQPTYPWKDTSKATGVCYLRSELSWRDLRDGTSSTYLVGEKYVSVGGYSTTSDSGYDQSWLSGVDLDISRWTIESPLQDSANVHTRRFGSAHSSGVHFALCDGSVRQVSYHVDGQIHRSLGHRYDRAPLSGFSTD